MLSKGGEGAASSITFKDTLLILWRRDKIFTPGEEPCQSRPVVSLYFSTSSWKFCTSFRIFGKFCDPKLSRSVK